MLENIKESYDGQLISYFASVSSSDGNHRLGAWRVCTDWANNGDFSEIHADNLQE